LLLSKADRDGELEDQAAPLQDVRVKPAVILLSSIIPTANPLRTQASTAGELALSSMIR